jgi:hypothetical protein
LQKLDDLFVRAVMYRSVSLRTQAAEVQHRVEGLPELLLVFERNEVVNLRVCPATRFRFEAVPRPTGLAIETGCFKTFAGESGGRRPLGSFAGGKSSRLFVEHRVESFLFIIRPDKLRSTCRFWIQFVRTQQPGRPGAYNSSPPFKVDDEDTVSFDFVTVATGLVQIKADFTPRPIAHAKLQFNCAAVVLTHKPLVEVGMCSGSITFVQQHAEMVLEYFPVALTHGDMALVRFCRGYVSFELGHQQMYLREQAGFPGEFDGIDEILCLPLRRRLVPPIGGLPCQGARNVTDPIFEVSLPTPLHQLQPMPRW